MYILIYNLITWNDNDNQLVAVNFSYTAYETSLDDTSSIKNSNV